MYNRSYLGGDTQVLEEPLLGRPELHPQPCRAIVFFATLASIFFLGTFARHLLLGRSGDEVTQSVVDVFRECTYLRTQGKSSSI